MKHYLSISLFILLFLSCNPPEHNFSLAIEVFPNPCIDQVFIRIADGVDFLNSEPISKIAELVDAETGDNIARFRFDDRSEIFNVDMTPYEAGQYYINFIAGGNFETSDVFLKVD